MGAEEVYRARRTSDRDVRTPLGGPNPLGLYRSMETSPSRRLWDGLSGLKQFLRRLGRAHALGANRREPP